MNKIFSIIAVMSLLLIGGQASAKMILIDQTATTVSGTDWVALNKQNTTDIHLVKMNIRPFGADGTIPYTLRYFYLTNPGSTTYWQSLPRETQLVDELIIRADQEIYVSLTFTPDSPIDVELKTYQESGALSLFASAGKQINQFIKRAEEAVRWFYLAKSF